ncbi:hypothetical protein WICPIJ_000298 [Wickerhamomyces pijperi]|uniref:Uncharacterized protein n=1 Tax=Wickerhamomyces pijperi TaxID=599730 RepID=A0A9P8TQY6_WICPI|nr:hypothetical protein WICPIJ_000298 [Wickerhamomyces pijperi]
MIPGQFGPTNLVLDWVFKMLAILNMSCCGIPSVMATANGISASMASSMAAAAMDGGTKIPVAVAPV